MDLEHTVQTFEQVMAKATEVALENGVECNGWTVQCDGDGCTAWLYTIDDDCQVSLQEEVESYATTLEAAKACLSWARSLKFS